MKLLVLLALVGAASTAALPHEAPVPVTDTEEVAQAKVEFQAAYEAAAAADEVPEVVVPDGAPSPVTDTEEVIAAKAKFQAAFDAAAAAAEAAPDHDLDGAISTYTGFLSTLDGRLSPYYNSFGLPTPLVHSAVPYSGLHYTGHHHAALPNGVPAALHYTGLPAALPATFPAALPYTYPAALPYTTFSALPGIHALPVINKVAK